MSSLITSKWCILLSTRINQFETNSIIHRTSLTDVDFCWQRCNTTHPRSFPFFSFTRDVSPQRGTGAYRRWRILCAETNRETLLLLRCKFEYNAAIEREFRAPFDELGRTTAFLSKISHYDPDRADSAVVDSVLQLRKLFGNVFTVGNGKKTRVTRISTNFDHGGLPLVYPT